MSPATGPRVVALGGGHGLAASLQALRRLTCHVTAVVTVADDGGSSGRLRTELDALPPGDLRMALAALAGDDDWGRTWEALLQHRFGGDGPLAGHAVGNLLLAGLAEVTGDPVTALDLTAKLLHLDGRVLPMTTERIDIVAEVAGLTPQGTTQVRGQVKVATTPGRVSAVTLDPPDPPATPAAVAAIDAAEWVVLGPGSLFTSMVPHLLVPGLRQAICRTRARRVLVLNLVPQTGETSGFTPAAHLEAVAAHVPDLPFDCVLADEGVLDRDGLMEAAADLGAQVRFAPVAAVGHAARHDPARLARAYADLMGIA
ncbi:MAG TPA: uridine diphosphate-N-acetylglucosamine-binding protein YvcK [Frankiaceae bacterium]|nr:uridine diphosphate-N-acetylglucosamine-binding protein YvcK [Frankiaceae bacterium]